MTYPTEGAAAQELIMFTPLPPRQNGIADYSYELLGGLRSEFDCTAVVIDCDGETAQAPVGVKVISTIEYIANRSRYAGILHVYQVGNNPDHIFLLPYLVQTPGVVVLHDPSLHHFLDTATVSLGDVDRYVSAMELEYGMAGKALGVQFRELGLREEWMFFDMPMLRGILGPSRGVVVHSRFAEAKVLANVPTARVTVVPHQFSPPASGYLATPSAMRRTLGIRNDEVLFMSLGFVTRAKKVDAALRALDRIRDKIPPFKYLIAGEIKPEEFDIHSLVAELGLEDQVQALGYVQEQQFFELVQGADIVINLRHPVLGETSGTMIRALGAGACVVVVDRGPFAEIPDEAALKIKWGRRFESDLAMGLEMLARDPLLRRRIGENARRYIAENNGLSATVAGYRQAIAGATQAAPRTWTSNVVWELLPPQELVARVRHARTYRSRQQLPLWFVSGIIPSSSTPGVQAVWSGDPSDIQLLTLAQDGPGPLFRQLHLCQFESQSSLLQRSLDLVVVVSDSEPGRISELIRAVPWLSRALKLGGLLIVYMSSSADVHGSLAQLRSDLERLVQQVGFKIELYESGAAVDPDDGFKGSSVVEERCWRALKATETFTRNDYFNDLAKGVTV